MKEAAEISMGTEISEDDIENIQHLCDQVFMRFFYLRFVFISGLCSLYMIIFFSAKVIEISSYRSQLYDYLRTRMMAVAPNLTVLLGELVGARLISHSGECHVFTRGILHTSLNFFFSVLMLLYF